jgi:hypothetical protein
MQYSVVCRMVLDLFLSMKMEAIYSSETSANFCKTIRCYTPQKYILHIFILFDHSLFKVKMQLKRD